MAISSGTHKSPGNGDAADMNGRDPHIEWLKDTSFGYFSVQAGEDRVWLPILIELHQGKTAMEFAGYAWLHGGDIAAARQWIRIPAMYAAPPVKLETGRYCTAIVTPEFFSQLDENAGLQEFVERIEIGASYQVPGPSFPVELGTLVSAPHKHVVGGIIDDGCAFALDRFTRSDGSSRVAYFWDQDGPGGVPDVGYGRETTDAAIDASRALASDESEIYRRLQFLDFGATGFKALGRRVSHGTAATDIAFGLPRNSVGPTKRMPIIAVKFPNRVTENPADFELDPWAIDALFYILLRADAIARQDRCGPLPVVVNMSYGLIHGPHDGTRILEKAIDQWITLREAGPNPVPLTVVLPAGNWYLDRVHAQIEVPGTGVSKRFTLRVPPDNPASSWTYLYIRRHHPGDNPILAVQVTDPSGRSTAWVPIGKKDDLKIGSAAVCALYYPTPSPGDHDLILLWIAPTVALDATAALARSGSWTIDVRNTGDPCIVESWLRRGEAPAGHPPFGRQARFDDAAYEKYDVAGRLVETDNASHIKRYGTLSGIATGDKSVVAGGARRHVQHDPPRKYRAASYSGAGPVVGVGSGRDPDVTALCEEGQTLHGVLTRGTYSGSTVAVNGTSVAAPKVAHAAWRLLATSPHADRSDIRKRAKPDPAIPAKQRGGDGAIVVPPVAPSGKISR